MIFSRSEQIAHINNTLQEVNNSIQKVTYNGSNGKSTASTVEESIFYTEQLFLELREFLFRVYTPKSPDFKRFQKNITAQFSITVQQITEPFLFYKITIPFLMPNQRSRSQSFKDSIGIALFNELSSFCRQHNVIPIKNSAVIFLTKYNEAIKKYNSDNDNKESKDTLNIISRHLITDDDGKLCDIMYKSKSTKQYPITEIYVTEKTHFIELHRLVECTE